MNLYGTICSAGLDGRSSVAEKGIECMSLCLVWSGSESLGELVIEGSLVPVLGVSVCGGSSLTPAPMLENSMRGML